MIDVNHLASKPRSQRTDNERVRLFQTRLYCKAKQDKTYRFYVLYDKLNLGYMLREAWKSVKTNKGVAGYDGMKITDVETYGVDQFLAEIAAELQAETYKPQPVIRVYIPKANGKMRPLGIPTVKDRIVQMSCKMVIEPIFEADFENNSYGFRPKRSAKDAVREIRRSVDKDRMHQVYDADLSGYFDNIPHDKLMQLVNKRIIDQRILKLIRMWLKAPIFENNQLKKSKKGTPQGGVISPLLANIYLHLVDKAVNRKDGHFFKFGVRIVRYADDFILMAKKIPIHCISYLQDMLKRMDLEINQDKTKLIDVMEEPFDFLGFTFRYDQSFYNKHHRFLNIVPRKKSCTTLHLKIREYLSHNRHKNPTELVKGLNPILRGWINYYTIPGVSYPLQAKRRLSYNLNYTLYKYYKRKSQRECKRMKPSPLQIMIDRYKLVDPIKYAPS